MTPLSRWPDEKRRRRRASQPQNRNAAWCCEVRDIMSQEESASGTSETLLAFSSGYLRLREPGSSFTVAEIPANRYLPFKQPKFSEHLIQLLWRNGLYDGSELKTTAGLPLKIVSPGRFNKSSGPDFKNAVITIGGEKVVGDVEIHKMSREWYEHKHHLSPLYNGTILHVCVERAANSPPAKTKKGKELPELELGLYMRHQIEELHEELESTQSPVTSRAGHAPCRKILVKTDPAEIARLLDLVGDGRMLIKSNRIIDRMDAKYPGQVLYETMFECMGYSRFNAQFGKIGAVANRAEVDRIIKSNPDIPPHLCAQAAYFRLSGLIPDGNTGADVQLAAYLSQLENVKLDGMEPIFDKKDWPLAGCRPANYPDRRIAAFAHIAAYGSSVEAYRELLDALPAPADSATTKFFLQNLLEKFTGISDPFWNNRYAFLRPTRHPKKMVGKDKAVSLVADGLIPFFLGLCRQVNDTKMEHRLVMVYHSLPIPASNAVIDYMKRNMIGRDNSFAARSVRHQQALLQVYKDFCHRAPAGCINCAFVEYLKTLK